MGTSFPALFETPWVSLHSPTPLWSLLLRQLLWSLNVMMSEYILQLTKALRKQIVFTASVCSLTFKCEAFHCYVYISFSEQSEWSKEQQEMGSQPEAGQTACVSHIHIQHNHTNRHTCLCLGTCGFFRKWCYSVGFMYKLMCLSPSTSTPTAEDKCRCKWCF